MCYSVYIYKYSWHLAKCSSKKTNPLKSSAQTIKENTKCYTQSLMFSWEMLPSEAVPVNLNGSTAMETGVFWSRRRTWYNWAFVCARWLPHSTCVCSEGWWCVSSEMSIHKMLCTHGRQGKYRELTESEVGRHRHIYMDAALTASTCRCDTSMLSPYGNKISFLYLFSLASMENFVRSRKDVKENS